MGFEIKKWVVLGVLASCPYWSFAQVPPKSLSGSTPAAVPQCQEDIAGPRALAVVWGRTSKKFVRGLESKNFSIYSGNENFPITCLSQYDSPLTVGILIDYSSSMNKDFLRSSLQGIKAFIEKSDPRNQYFAYGFTGKPFLMLQTSSDRATIDAFLVNALKEKTKGTTAYYDAFDAVLEKMSDYPMKRRVILQITDKGEDFSQNAHYDSVSKRLRETNIQLFRVGFIDGFHLRDLTLESKSDNSTYSIFDTFGIVYVSRENPNPAGFERLANELRNQYLIGFLPAKRRNKWREVTIAAKLPMDFELVRVFGTRGFWY